VWGEEYKKNGCGKEKGTHSHGERPPLF